MKSLNFIDLVTSNETRITVNKRYIITCMLSSEPGFTKIVIDRNRGAEPKLELNVKIEHSEFINWLHTT